MVSENPYSLYGKFGCVNCIRRELYGTAKNAVALGFYLNELREFEEWKESDFYKKFKPEKYITKKGIVKFTTYDFYSYCKDEFNLSRRSVDRFIDINAAFCKRTSSGRRSKAIDSGYENYKPSQLAEMLQLNDKQLKLVKPDMSVKEIREIKAETDSISPEDVNVVHDKDYDREDKKYKGKNYHVNGLVYDRFVSSPSQYTQQFIKVQEYLNKGYLLRLVLYAPEDNNNSEQSGKVI